MSNYIVETRGTGKTRRLMENAKTQNAAFICKNPAAMARKAAAYGIYGISFISYSDILMNLRTDYAGGSIYPNENFVIDEIKDFMDYLLASNCVGFTQTEDD